MPVSQRRLPIFSKHKAQAGVGAVDIRHERDNRYILSGSLLFANVESLEGVMDKLLQEHDSLLIDLGQLVHVDSAGLALLVEWVRMGQDSKQHIQYLNMPEQALSIAGVSGLDAVLPIKRG